MTCILALRLFRIVDLLESMNAELTKLESAPSGQADDACAAISARLNSVAFEILDARNEIINNGKEGS